MIRVAIADDHREMRVALRLLLGTAEDMEVVCEASNGREAVECVIRCQPDVLVMDIRMPELDGFAATKEITKLPLTTRIILISIEEGKPYARRAAAVGAQGFVPKDEVVTALLLAVRTVYRGEQYFLD
jgi:DNA-binding NarL/FixJ family response regulator